MLWRISGAGGLTRCEPTRWCAHETSQCVGFMAIGTSSVIHEFGRTVAIRESTRLHPWIEGSDFSPGYCSSQMYVRAYTYIWGC